MSHSTTAWFFTPTPPLIRTLGASVYPDPAFVSVKPVITLPAICTVAVAPDPPPPPINSTVGTCVCGNEKPPPVPAPVPLAKKFTPLS